MSSIIAHGLYTGQSGRRHSCSSLNRCNDDAPSMSRILRTSLMSAAVLLKSPSSALSPASGCDLRNAHSTCDHPVHDQQSQCNTTLKKASACGGPGMTEGVPDLLPKRLRVSASMAAAFRPAHSITLDGRCAIRATLRPEACTARSYVSSPSARRREPHPPASYTGACC